MPMFNRSMLVLLAILFLAGGYAFYSCESASDNETQLDSTLLPKEYNTEAKEQEAGSGQEVAVYVTGAVVHPGLVYIADDARVVDAVNMCDGLLPEADLNAVNMAQVVKDGMHIKIPEKGKAGAGKNSSGTAGNASRPDNKEDNGGNLVNINTADAQALTKIKGIGPAMAQKIIDYRESNGSFQSVEELQKVKGIGPGKYAKIQGQVTI